MADFQDTVFLHPAASLLGSVTIGEYSSVWPGASVRGDFSPVRIGRGTSIQDCCVIHTTPADPVDVGDLVTIGHGAVLHGCTVEDCCLIGMNSTVLDKAKIGRGSVVAAGAVVKEGTQVPPGSFVAGMPAEAKPGKKGQEQWIREGASAYIALARNYLEGGETIDPETLEHKIKEIEKDISAI